MSAISDAAVAANGPTRQNASRFNELASEDFIQIIFTELTNQDPLAPNDTSALLDQLNSIRSIESGTCSGCQVPAESHHGQCTGHPCRRMKKADFPI